MKFAIIPFYCSTFLGVCCETILPASPGLAVALGAPKLRGTKQWNEAAYNWQQKIFDATKPLRKLYYGELNRGKYLQFDETSIEIQKQDKDFF